MQNYRRPEEGWLEGGRRMDELYWPVLQVNAESAYWSSTEVAGRTAPWYTEAAVEEDLALLYTAGVMDRVAVIEDSAIYADVADDALDAFYDAYLK